MPIHDLKCNECGEVKFDCFYRLPWPERIECSNKHLMEITYAFWRYRRRGNAQWDKRDRIVVWENPKTGQIAYPGRNDIPMPERYEKQGFIVRDMRSFQDVDRLEKDRNVVSEVRNFNCNGRGLEDGNRWGL